MIQHATNTYFKKFHQNVTVSLIKILKDEIEEAFNTYAFHFLDPRNIPTDVPNDIGIEKANIIYSLYSEKIKWVSFKVKGTKYLQ